MAAARALMIQGAGSNVGKSLIVAGLCRHFTRAGLRVRPFKPQNMSNNAAVTADGGEIGRAQALQARACGVEPMVDMNPVLLKPESERGAQVVLQGRRLTTTQARGYADLKPSLMGPVLQSFARLKSEADLVVVEGAGSPAEINLRAGDIANMGFAVAADVPVALVGDIDRGGVIAQLAGTAVVLSKQDAAQVKGFLINKFRGDPSLFDDGYRFIETQTGWRGLGVAPWFSDAARLPAEDALDLGRGAAPAAPTAGEMAGADRPLTIACPIFSRIANFDDLDPLRMTPGVRLTLTPPGEALPGDADLIILPGSKSTRADLDALRREGWDIDLQAHWRRGGRILGICGGYQMLGRRIEDPDGVEGPPGGVDGLGLLNVATVMSGDKRLVRVAGRHAETGAALSGYEIHIGRTDGPDAARPFAEVAGAPEGARSADGRVEGAYLHGVFADDGFRRAYLRALAPSASAGAFAYDALVDQTLDALADHLAAHLDVAAMAAIAGL